MGHLNFKPRTIFCRDNLDVLRGISSGCIDLVYLDPPFNKKKVFTAPIGSDAEGAEFSDIFREEDVKDEWVQSIKSENKKDGLSALHSYLQGVSDFGNRYNYCYLVYMAIRLIECRRVLKSTGSIWLHCDPTMSHYLKIVLDCIFGEKNFRNEVVWFYNKWTNAARYFQRNHDTVFFYSKSSAYLFRKAFTLTGHKSRVLARGWDRNVANGVPQLLVYERELARAKIAAAKKSGVKIVYMDDKPEGVAAPDVWGDINYLSSGAKERTGYPTQKPLALMERIIKAGSGEGDMVLDPFCGCATTCVAAEKLRRQWAGIDISHKAYELVNERLEAMYREQSGGSVTHPLLLGKYVKANFTTKPPKRGKDEAREKGFVYVIGNSSWPGVYKVGVAKDVTRRLNSYHTADPYRDYQVEFKRETPHYLAIERHIHRKFNAANEWVKVKDLQTLISAIKAADARAKRGLTLA